MFIGVARLYADPIHDALVSYITFTHLRNKLHSIVYTLNLMRHQAFIRLGDKILPYALKNANDLGKYEKVEIITYPHSYTM